MNNIVARHRKGKNMESSEINFLKRNNLTNPHRIKYLMGNAIKLNNLDLSDLVVFTEAASGNYIVTPIIAAMAGAKVYAVTCDSTYGTIKDIQNLTYKFAAFCGVKDKIKVISDKKREYIFESNIVTNLGFVRPIDEKFVAMMNEKAVIPYMREAWEYRATDIDLDAIISKNIPVMATNEEYLGLDVLNFVGPLCIKMIFELDIEVYKSKIVILSGDKFGSIIEKFLKLMGGDIYLTDNLKSKTAKCHLENCDALVVADFSKDFFIGKHITGRELTELSRAISVVQFAGDVDIEELAKFNIPYFPNRKIGNCVMGQTLANIGPRPVIDLHCAGLKVGEVMARARKKGLSLKETKYLALNNSPAQELYEL